MSAPSFARTVAALRVTDRRYPWVGPTPEEDDAAAALEAIEELHRPGTDEPDADGRWGRCLGCRGWWPCPVWVEGEFLAVQYLGRAADRVAARATRPVVKTDADHVSPSTREVAS